MKLEQQSRVRDEVVSTILDLIVDLKELDTTCVLPESLLGRDLEMSDSEIAEFANRLSHRFMPEGKFDHSNWGEISLRQVVSLVRGAYVKAS